MGLTNWRGAKVRKPDVTIAKNYLSEPELAALNNLVEQYLLFAEGQAMRTALARLNPALPPEGITAAVDELIRGCSAMGSKRRRGKAAGLDLLMA